jgi:hypothetical protein
MPGNARTGQKASYTRSAAAGLQRDAAMLATYGFGLFPLPAYRETRLGNWRVVQHLASLADGYVSGAVIEPRRYVLYHGRTAWMSTGLMEQQSHAFHVHQARGVVVAAGLGMGLYAYAVSCKPEVERVVVIERSPEVVAIMRTATAFDRWPGRDKVAILEADALAADFAPRALAVGGRRPDYLFADIWPTCAAPCAPAESAAMIRALRPKAAGWWGQELSFGLWCRDQLRPPDETALREYFASVSVPVPVTAGYVAFCRDVVAATPPGGPRTSMTSAWRDWWGRILPPSRRLGAK